jgi:hypothetical protein
VQRYTCRNEFLILSSPTGPSSRDNEKKYKMGGSVSKLMGKIFGSKEMRILMLGLDAAGKTSMNN